MDVELNEALLAKLAGWEAVKQARTLLAADRVLSSFWEPPLLRGVVQEGSASYRASLIIKSASDAENLCTCRQAREWGTICAHCIAVGLHHLRRDSASTTQTERQSLVSKPTAAPKPTTKPVKRLNREATGEPLELFLILPPNFAQAMGKGKVMLCLEGKWRNGRVSLAALPLSTHFELSAQDAALLDALEAMNGGETPSMVLLNAEQFTELLPNLVEHPRITLGKTQSLEIAGQPMQLTLRATLEQDGQIVLRLAQAAPAGLIRGAGAWVLAGHTLQRADLPAGLEEIFAGPVRIPRSRIPQFLNLEWPRLVASCAVESNFAVDDFVLEPARPKFKLHLTGGLAMLQAKLECYYGEKRVTPGRSSKEDALWMADPTSSTRYYTRNLPAEEAALGSLLRYGFSVPDAEGISKLNVQNLILKFFAREFPRLEKEWEVTLEERLERSTQQNIERIEPRFAITPSGEQWFDLNVAYESSGGERFSAAEVQRLLLSGQSHTRLKNGKIALIDTGAVEEFQEVLVDCAPQQHAQGYRLHNAQAGFLDSTLRQQGGWRVQAPSGWTQRVAQQKGEIKLSPPPLGELDSVLRPYQKEGVAWLQFLRANRFGGILADEMGLGKTLQVLAHIACNAGQASRLSMNAQKGIPAVVPGKQGDATGDSGTGGMPVLPTLVVCPTSLVFNWAAEAAKFTPQLRVLTVEGPQRHESFAKIPAHDVVITSYALLRRDADLYRELEFDTVVLDEAQHIKNRQTQNAQAVKSIHSRNRLVLTGTPLENSVLDLWSIFDFLMPGYLGSAQDFRDRYEGPIAREKNTEAQSRLARRLRPFMLRRFKREVAADLPEKIEQVSFCELSESQRALYQQVLESSRREVLNAVEQNGLAKSRMVVLTALLRLRQICCDLRLLESKLSPGAAAEPSGKTELFSELLEEVLDGGHRALVFSQFTSMLGLLRERLAAEGIECCYLDGSTRNRAEVVEQFQRDARIPVFLISLKAGGVGLNLTGADTVIHFDPWWNPAVEAQATDRAHRIGQKKVVTSYKLITRGTVEEKILNLQARKRALIAGMLGDEEQLTQGLSWEEIQDLFKD